MQPPSELALPVHLPNCLPPPKAPSTAMPQQEGPSPKFQLYHSMINPTLNPEQDQEEGDQISWNTHISGLWMTCPSLATAIPICWRDIKASGRTSLGAHIAQEGHNNFAAQHYAIWQVAAFRLHVAQQEASGWWDNPPVLHGLCPENLLPVM